MRRSEDEPVGHLRTAARSPPWPFMVERQPIATSRRKPDRGLQPDGMCGVFVDHELAGSGRFSAAAVRVKPSTCTAATDGASPPGPTLVLGTRVTSRPEHRRQACS